MVFIIDKTSSGAKKVNYVDGGKVQTIHKDHLRDIRSRVVTHEGETLHGRAGEHYQDTYSERYLGKKLEGSYRDDKVGWYLLLFAPEA